MNVIDNKHNIYIIRVYNSKGEGLIKLGYSGKIKERLYTYYSHNPFTELVYSTYVEDGFLLEQKIHKTFSSLCMNEWYSESLLENFIQLISNSTINSTAKPELIEPLIIERKLYNLLLEELSSSELKILMLLGVRIHVSTNIVMGIGSNTSDRRISEILEISTKRRSIKPAFERFLELNLIKFVGDKLVVNPSVIRCTPMISQETYKLFE